MATIVRLYRRWRQRVKLRRGRCEVCGTILRDDQRELCGSEQCDIEARADRSW